MPKNKFVTDNIDLDGKNIKLIIIDLSKIPLGSIHF